MSSPVSPERGGDRTDAVTTMMARLSAGAGLLLSHLPPAAIRRILTAVVGRGRKPDYEEVVFCRRAIVAVSRMCAGEGCLPRSIATALMARWYGFGVTWCTGVQDRPFAAHAWVEVDGRPVDEVADLSGFHRIMVAIPAYAVVCDKDRRS